MRLAARLNDWRWPCACVLMASVAAMSGCAGGAWLESPIEGELPIDPPKHGYPTAITNATASKPVAVVGEAQPIAAAATAHPAAASHERHRLGRPQPLVTTLAVVPPQFVHGPPNAAQAATPAAAATATANVAQESANSAVATGHPTGMPQIDVSGLDSLANWQSPVAAVAPVVAATSANENAVKSVSHEAVAQENSATPADRPSTLERAHRELIEALEVEIRQRREQSSSDEALPRLEQQLRLAYLAAGHMDEAVTAVESLDAAQKEAYKNLMFGLGVWLSPDEARRAPLRTAKVLHSLREATSDLAAASKLELKNLAFCERVDQFGWFSEFPRKEFQPKQQVILYAEVENFAAETKGPAGFETELQGSYVILDSSGQEVASRQLQLDKEVCRNYRRDYFLAYRIYLPDNIAPGRYRLELTVEDLKARGKYQGRKLGDGVIEFAIR